MFARQRLRELAERTRLVRLQADLYRGLLRCDAVALRGRWTQLRTLQAGWQRHRALVTAGTLLGGLLFRRQAQRATVWLPAILAAWRWWRK